MPDIRPCRRCGAEVLLMPTVWGRWTTINPQPDARGTLVIEVARAADSGTATGMSRLRRVRRGVDADELRFMPHWKTCPRWPREGDPVRRVWEVPS